MTNEPPTLMERMAPRTAARLAQIPEHKRSKKIGRTVGGLVILAVVGVGIWLKWNQYLLAGLGVLAGSVWAGEYVTAPFAAITEGAVRLIMAARGKGDDRPPSAEG